MRSSDKAPGGSPASARIDRNRAGAAKALFAAVPAFFAFVTVAAFLSAWDRLRSEPTPVTGAEEALARSAWYASGSRDAVPWPDAPALIAAGGSGPTFDGPLHAASAILIDASNGTVLYEKDADIEIPPASMTKLVAMYVAFRAMDSGTLAPDETIVPPEASWAENIPPHSSLMFLGKGQRLTVRELLRGMATVSGNDAAIALAWRVSGGVGPFVDLMNGEVRRLGLSRTRYVEPTGLSERNLTTAREFADFSSVYAREHPEALAEYHSVAKLTYPEAHNLPAEGEGSDNPNPVLAGLVPITQRATNPLIGVLPGCDGLKTGYIDESGYNLSLTAERDGTRFISVTLGGPGNNAAEGNRYREEDGRALMEWAFASWVTAVQPETARHAVVVWGGKKGAILAIPARTDPLTVPKGSPGPFTAKAVMPRAVEAPVAAGDRVGTLEVQDAEGRLVSEIPLLADRNSPVAGLPARSWDRAVRAAAGIMVPSGTD